MAFWGRNRWIGAAAHYSASPVTPWDESRVEAAGYRLSVGSEIYTNGDPSAAVRRLTDGEGFVIQPGQFAFILTNEKVNIPRDAIGFISIRASIKFLGLVNVSGFQVNPGFSGNLIFAVFNAGPKHVNLRQGDQIFSLWISDLDKAVDDDFEVSGKVPNHLASIPSEIINGIAGDSLTAYQLSEKINKLSELIQKGRDETQKVREETQKVRDELQETKKHVVYMVTVMAVLVAVSLIIFRDNLVNLFSSIPTEVQAVEAEIKATDPPPTPLTP